MIRTSEITTKVKEVWQQFRPAILFVLTFIVIYGGSTVFYAVYLNSLKNEVDVFTTATSNQAKSLLEYFGYEASLQFYPDKNSVTIYLKNNPAVQVIEGCNGFTVLLLFVSFLFAYRSRLKLYLWYIPLTVPLLWGVNVLRVYWLAIVINENGREVFAWQKSVFTASIYLVILLFWMLWIKLASSKKAE